MAFLTDTLARAAFKRTLGKGHTSGSKDIANEAEASFITIAARDIFADRIPNTSAAAISAGVSTSLVSLTLTLDPSSNGKAYFASITTVSGSPLQGKTNPRTGAPYANSDRVGFLIPPQYGSDFRAILKNNGTEVAPSSSEDWFIDYVAGIVTSEDNLSLVNGTLEAYVYSGRYLDSVVITHDLFTTQADGYGVFAKGPGGVDGYSIVTNNVGIGTTTPSDKLTISTSSSGGIAINNSSLNDPTLKFKILNTDTFVAGIDNSDADKFKIERGSTLGINNDISVNQTDGYVGIGTNNPQQKLQINGSLRFGPNNESIIGDFDLAVGAETNLLIVADSNSTAGSPTGNIMFGGGSATAAANATYSSMFPLGVPRAEYMRIRGTDGYVGIGTTAPALNGKLTVSDGNIQVLNGSVLLSSGNVVLQTNGAYIGRDQQNSVSWDLASGDGSLNFIGSGYINIDSNNTDADTQALFIGKNQTGASSSILATVHENGRVGIGTTNPDFKLTIHGSSGGASTFKTNGLLLRATNTGTSGESVIAWQSDGPGNNSSNYWMAGIDDAVSGLNFGYGSTFTSTSMIMHIGTDGYVGIGTTTPRAKINIYDGYDSSTQTNFTQNLHSPGFLVTSDYVNGNFVPGLFWSTQNDNNTKPKIGIYGRMTASGSYLYFGTSNSYATGITNDAMTIAYNGEVGIGTTNPQQALHINGNLRLGILDNDAAVIGDGDLALAGDSDVLVVSDLNSTAGTPAGDIIFGSGSASAATNAAFATMFPANLPRVEYMRILGSGEVGIGITNPTERLVVSNGTAAKDIFVAKENTTDVFILPDGMAAPSASNSILTASTSAVTSWKTPQALDLAVRLTTYISFEDFLLAEGYAGGSLADGDTLSNGYLVRNSAATVDVRSAGTVTENHPGVVDLSVTTLNDYASLLSGGGSSFTVSTGQVFNLVGYFDIRTLNGADDQKFVFGVTTSITGDPGTISASDVVLIYDNTTSTWRSSVGGVLNTSGFTVTTGWNKLELQFTGGGTVATFRINGSTYSRGSVTLPTATTDLYTWAGLKKVNGSATNFVVGVDCIGFSVSDITRG